jgi:hypothetical protein
MWPSASLILWTLLARVYLLLGYQIGSYRSPGTSDTEVESRECAIDNVLVEPDSEGNFYCYVCGALLTTKVD